MRALPARLARTLGLVALGTFHERRGDQALLEIKNMMDHAQDYLVERRTDEHFEAAKQEAETLIAEIERLFPEIERVVGSADFGRDAIAKARPTVDRTRAAITSKDTGLVKEQVDQLSRTQRMFKGVVSRG